MRRNSALTRSRASALARRNDRVCALDALLTRLIEQARRGEDSTPAPSTVCASLAAAAPGAEMQQPPSKKPRPAGEPKPAAEPSPPARKRGNGGAVADSAGRGRGGASNNKAPRDDSFSHGCDAAADAGRTAGHNAAGHNAGPPERLYDLRAGPGRPSVAHSVGAALFFLRYVHSEFEWQVAVQWSSSGVVVEWQQKHQQQ